MKVDAPRFRAAAVGFGLVALLTVGYALLSEPAILEENPWRDPVPRQERAHNASSDHQASEVLRTPLEDIESMDDSLMARGVIRVTARFEDSVFERYMTGCLLGVLNDEEHLLQFEVVSEGSVDVPKPAGFKLEKLFLHGPFHIESANSRSVWREDWRDINVSTHGNVVGLDESVCEVEVYLSASDLFRVTIDLSSHNGDPSQCYLLIPLGTEASQRAEQIAPDALGRFWVPMKSVGETAFDDWILVQHSKGQSRVWRLRQGDFSVFTDRWLILRPTNAPAVHELSPLSLSLPKTSSGS